MPLEKEFLDPQPGFTQVVTTSAGGVKTIYVSGQVGRDPVTKKPAADLKEQAKLTYANLLERLAKAGAKREDIVKTTAFIVNIDPKKVRTVAIAQIKAFGEEKMPASTWVGITGLVEPELELEVEAIAVVEG